METQHLAGFYPACEVLGEDLRACWIEYFYIDISGTSKWPTKKLTHSLAWWQDVLIRIFETSNGGDWSHRMHEFLVDTEFKGGAIKEVDKRDVYQPGARVPPSDGGSGGVWP